jgi:hypothetical protein
MIIQFIAYLEVLKKQWLELISNNLRINNLFFPLHEYLRKEVVRKNVNMSNRKIVKKTTRQIKVVETKFFQKQQTKQKDKFNKRNYVNKRLKTNIANEFQMITIIITSSNQKRARSIKNLSHITCYACNKIDHYKSQCKNNDFDKKTRKDRNRSTWFTCWRFVNVKKNFLICERRWNSIYRQIRKRLSH